MCMHYRVAQSSPLSGKLFQTEENFALPIQETPKTKKQKKSFFSVFSPLNLHDVKKRSFCASLWGHYSSVTTVNQPEFFESEAQSSLLSGTVFRFFFGQKLTILQPLKQTPLFGQFLGNFSGTTKRGWHHMPPNLTHIISKKLPSFWYMTCPEAICGCRKKLLVFFWITLYEKTR